MKHLLFSRASVLGLSTVLAVGLAACQKSADDGGRGASGQAYGVVANSQETGPAPAGGGDYSGYAQPVSELAPNPPPELPTYDQPPPPNDGDIWTPGYWAWDSDNQDYYWAPGVWVEPPRRGYYWTPGYWRYLENGYGFIPGYWGPTVGFYGGINYGFGYGGDGYDGGRWQGNQFAYNSAANNLGSNRFAGTYSEPVKTAYAGHASFNGGAHGAKASAPAPDTGRQEGERIGPTAAQTRTVRMAAALPGQRASVNHGAPSVVATSRAGELSGPGVVTQVRAAPHYEAPTHTAGAPAAAERPTTQRPPAAISGATGRPVAAARAAPDMRAQPQTRVAPESRPAETPRAAPVARPAPEMRQAPVARQAPEARPAPEPRSAPQARPAAPPQQRMAPPPQARAAPAPHPAPPRPAPAARPAEPERHPN